MKIELDIAPRYRATPQLCSESDRSQIPSVAAGFWGCWNLQTPVRCSGFGQAAPQRAGASRDSISIPQHSWDEGLRAEPELLPCIQGISCSPGKTPCTKAAKTEAKGWHIINHSHCSDQPFFGFFSPRLFKQFFQKGSLLYSWGGSPASYKLFQRNFSFVLVKRVDLWLFLAPLGSWGSKGGWQSVVSLSSFSLP